MYDRVNKSVQYILNQKNFMPQIGIILGSGLDFSSEIKEPFEIPYKDILGFPQVTVSGHAGSLILGSLYNIPIIVFKGRFHYYEGYTMKEVAYPVYVMKQLGAKMLFVTNACGGINRKFEPGTLMLIRDFINLMGTNPLIGANDERFGPRFPDMTEPFSKKLLERAKQVADIHEISYEEGVYAGFMGPYYETSAEIISIDRMGADAVGMSTVPETIVANYLNMKVLGISCITNMATGIQQKKHDHAHVIEVANKSSSILQKWLLAIINSLYEEPLKF